MAIRPATAPSYLHGADPRLARFAPAFVPAIDPPPWWAQWGIRKSVFDILADGSWTVYPQSLFGINGDDAVLINYGLQQSGFVRLGPFQYSIQTPILMQSDFQVLQGAGFPFATTIISAFASGQPEMILVSGASAPLNQVTVRDLALKGNGSTGHGLVFRSNNGLVENVVVQGQGLTGDSFHLALDALPATGVFDVTMSNCYAMQPGSTGTGFLLDSNYNSCELVICRSVGGTSPAAKGGAWGFQIAGSQNKLIACHADLYLSGGGALLTGSGHQVIGGEYETNAGPGILLNGASDCKIASTSHYGNTSTQDISLTNSAQYNTINGATFESSAVTSAVTGDATVTHNGVTGCRSKAAKGFNFAAGANFQIISLNDLNGATITHSGANDIVTNNL